MNELGKVVYSMSSSGKSDISIVDEYFIPICPYITNYLDRAIKQIINTKKAYAYQLLFIYRYFNSQQIDIPTRVINGEYFTNKEYEEFKLHCSYKDDEWMKEEINISSFKRFSDKQLDKMIHASSSSNEIVKESTVKGRLTRFAHFIEYLHNQHHFTAKPDSEVHYKCSTLIRQIKDDRKNIKDENDEVKDPFESEIPDDIYKALKECIEPNSPNNPFTVAPRDRNYLIVRLAMEGGLRRSSIAKLKQSDIKDDWDNPRITNTRTPNDPTDLRPDKPSQKTKAHVTATSKNTMKSLVSYVDHVRSSYPLSVTHEFVFVAEKGSKGSPLSLRGVDYVFKRLGEYLGFHLNPHKLRHKWNEEFDAAADKLGYSGESKEDIRKSAMGWSEGSKMGSTYNAKALAEKAQKVLQEMQREQFSNGESDD